VRALVDSSQAREKSNYDKFTSPGDNIFATQQDVLQYGISQMACSRSRGRRDGPACIWRSRLPLTGAKSRIDSTFSKIGATAKRGGEWRNNLITRHITRAGQVAALARKCGWRRYGASGNPPSSQTPAAALSASALNLSSTVPAVRESGPNQRQDSHLYLAGKRHAAAHRCGLTPNT